MILLFDLDRTLINSDKLTKALSNIFGISTDKFGSHVDAFFRKTNKHYSPEAHIKILRKIGHIKNRGEEKIVNARYKGFLPNLPNYLFPETEETLDILKKQGHRLIMVTLGEPASQKRKIDNTGVKKYFEKIIYEKKDKSKNKFLKQLAKTGQDIIIVNDKATESLEMQKMLGKKAKIYLINGPHAQNTLHKEKIYDSIKELKNIL